jgi:hypothetical protein
MRLFALWVQAGLKTLIRTPRAAFFTLVFPMILLLLIDSTNSGSVTAAGGKVDFAQYFTPSLAIFGLSFACYTAWSSRSRAPASWGHLAVLAVWTVVGARIAVRRFRWDPVAPGSRGRQREPDVRPATG